MEDLFHRYGKDRTSNTALCGKEGDPQIQLTDYSDRVTCPRCRFLAAKKDDGPLTDDERALFHLFLARASIDDFRTPSMDPRLEPVGIGVPLTEQGLWHLIRTITPFQAPDRAACERLYRIMQKQTPPSEEHP